jgi:hypothetical protein
MDMQVIKEMTGGAGADYCFECIGSVSVMAEAFKSSRMGWGKTVVLGVDGSAAPISIPSLDILRGRSVVGSFLGGIKPKDDIPVLARKCLNKVITSTQPAVHFALVSSCRSEIGMDVRHDIVMMFLFCVWAAALRRRAGRSWSWTRSSRTRWDSTTSTARSTFLRGGSASDASSGWTAPPARVKVEPDMSSARRSTSFRSRRC